MELRQAPDDPTAWARRDVSPCAPAFPVCRRRGSAWCDWCLGELPAGGVDVDHVRPLALGGEDLDTNVQVPCHGCHELKTRTEFGGARDVA
ncbi:HNH endonuclease [Streptomyces albidoflavus]|uniref:HNH endonuclease n=1 Tax=Streptomyces albidoflavus TaxID=1886 RepID=UPI00101E2348|nr:HNH endonuclease signature motif containing protein [Streptomyces albidoflavus]